MDAWNRAVFLAINASDHPVPGSVPVAMALADRAIFLVPLLFAALWLRGDPNSRAGIFLTFCAAEVALGLNQPPRWSGTTRGPSRSPSAGRWSTTRPTVPS